MEEYTRFYPYALVCVKRPCPSVGKRDHTMRGGKRPKTKPKTLELAKLAYFPFSEDRRESHIPVSGMKDDRAAANQYQRRDCLHRACRPAAAGRLSEQWDRWPSKKRRGRRKLFDNNRLYREKFPFRAGSCPTPVWDKGQRPGSPFRLQCVVLHQAVCILRRGPLS
jgi:hypothetical protein